MPTRLLKPPKPPAAERRQPAGRRGSFAAADLRVTSVSAAGSTNVADFGWQPLDADVLAEYLAAVETYGSPQYAALAFRGDPEGVLAVTFRNGATYQYAPVPLNVFVGMLNAGSRGRFVWDVLRRYPFIGPL